jgi:hypothetical protein
MECPMRMPFGKYKDCDLCDIPHDYLRWVLANLRRLGPKLREGICRELNDWSIHCDAAEPQRERGKATNASRHNGSTKTKPLTDMELMSIIKSWHKKMFLRFNSYLRGNTTFSVKDNCEELVKMLQEALQKH